MSDEITQVRVGHPVPDFELNTYDPESHGFGKLSLAEQKRAGKWTILFFYPADFTFVWATEFAALAEQYARFKRMGAEVVTVSTDTEFVHLAWKRDEKELAEVAYPMAADPTGRVARLFGVYDETSGLAQRGAFIISPEGILMNTEINANNMGRNIDELMRKFKANIYLARKTTEGCPSKWKEDGDATLRPGPEMVGRVHQALNP